MSKKSITFAQKFEMPYEKNSFFTTFCFRFNSH